MWPLLPAVSPLCFVFPSQASLPVSLCPLRATRHGCSSGFPPLCFLPRVLLPGTVGVVPGHSIPGADLPALPQLLLWLHHGLGAHRHHHWTELQCFRGLRYTGYKVCPGAVRVGSKAQDVSGPRGPALLSPLFSSGETRATGVPCNVVTGSWWSALGCS